MWVVCAFAGVLLVLAALAALDRQPPPDPIARRLQRRDELLEFIDATEPTVYGNDPPRKPPRMLGFAVRVRCDRCSGTQYFGPARDPYQLAKLLAVVAHVTKCEKGGTLEYDAVVLGRGLLPQLRPVEFTPDGAFILIPNLQPPTEKPS